MTQEISILLLEDKLQITKTCTCVGSLQYFERFLVDLSIAKPVLHSLIPMYIMFDCLSECFMFLRIGAYTHCNAMKRIIQLRFI